jgi:hypothetical protein
MNAINQPQTIITAKSGHQVPKELWETALRKCPTASGYAIRDTTDGKTTLETEHYDQSVTVENMLTLEEQAKEYDRVYYLANLPGTHTKDDVQPFVLTIYDNEEDKIGTDILSFFVEGDFPKYTSKDHTDEYNFAWDIIIPTLQDMFLSADQDISKFTASLHKPLFEKNMMAHVGHRAAFVFLPLQGEPIQFGTNELGAGFDWGSCSQHLDFQKAVKPITKAEAVVKAAGKFNPFKKKEGIQTDDKGIHHTEPKKDVIDKVATDTMLGKKLIRPPSKLDKSGKNRWLRLFNNGDLPKDHDHKDFPGLWISPEVLPYAQRDVSSLAQVDALGAEMRTGIRKVGNTSFVDKNVRPASDYLPTLSDAEMTAQTGILAKFIDRSKVPSALEIQKMEAKWPTYSEKMGIPFEDMFRWTDIEVLEVCNGHKPSMMLVLEFRRRLIEKWDPAGFASTVKTGTETTKHIEAKEILKPETAASKRAAIFGKKTG